MLGPILKIGNPKNVEYWEGDEPAPGLHAHGVVGVLRSNAKPMFYMQDDMGVLWKGIHELAVQSTIDALKPHPRSWLNRIFRRL